MWNQIDGSCASVSSKRSMEPALHVKQTNILFLQLVEHEPRSYDKYSPPRSILRVRN
jgi:hypothetical protein